METHTIDVTEGAPVSFSGELLRAVNTPGVGNNHSQSRHVLRLYKTEAGGYVLEVEYETTFANDLQRKRVFFADSPGQVLNALTAYDAAQDKTGWPAGSGLDTRRAQVEQRLRRNFAAAANQLSAALPGACLELGPVAQSWTCDACGAAIEHAGEGCVEWSGPKVRLIHERCASSESLSEPLAECLGPDGLLRLLALSGEHDIDRAGVLEVIRRCHIPLYERARPYFARAEAASIVDLEMAPGSYRQELLTEILKRFEKPELC